MSATRTPLNMYWQIVNISHWIFFIFEESYYMHLHPDNFIVVIFTIIRKLIPGVFFGRNHTGKIENSVGRQWVVGETLIVVSHHVFILFLKA